MSGIELNKIAAAVLLAGLIAMVVGSVTEGLYHEGESDKRGYKVEGATDMADAGGAAPVEEKPVDISSYMAKADIAAGEKLLGRCTSCHTFEKGKPNGVGPNQYNLVGRKVASEEGYTYSEAMKTHKGSWGFQELSDFLNSPQKFIPGTKMAYAGLKKPEERANLIAYINATFSDHPLKLPAK